MAAVSSNQKCHGRRPTGPSEAPATPAAPISSAFSARIESLPGCGRCGIRPSTRGEFKSRNRNISNSVPPHGYYRGIVVQRSTCEVFGDIDQRLAKHFGRSAQIALD